MYLAPSRRGLKLAQPESEREFARARELYQKELIVLRAKGDRNWGVSLRNQGKLQDAALAFRHALEEDPALLRRAR